MPTTFADLVPITPVSSHQYSLHLDDQWCIGTVPNGGYITSCFLIAARTHMQTTHPTHSGIHPINLHLEFLRRTAVGPARFSIKDTKLGSRISNLHLTLSQPGPSGTWQDEVEGYVTMSNIATETGLSLDTSYAPHPPPLPVSIPTLATTGEDTNYIRRGEEPFPEFRRAVLNIQMYLIKPSRRPASRPRSVNDLWVRFAPNRTPGSGRWTNDALGYLVDIFPQVVEQYINPVAEDAAATASSTDKLRQVIKDNTPRAKYWYPTLVLNLDVKKLMPEEGVDWLFVRVRAKAIRNGRFDLVVEVWDEGGEIVASSTHASLVVDASRNTAKRSGGEKKAGGKESKI